MFQKVGLKIMLAAETVVKLDVKCHWISVGGVLTPKAWLAIVD